MALLETALAGATDWVRLSDGVRTPRAGDPPPGLITQFGFNQWSSYNAYTNGANESATQMLTRLNSDYGSYEWSKHFYGGSFVPATWGALSNGENNVLNPATKHILCCTWTPGTIANGSRDAYITTLVESVPAGHTILPCINEVDAPGRMSNWPAYVSDMDHLYDLAESLNLDTSHGRLEVMDCFMSYALENGSGPRWQDSWTNATKRHGIIWDCYWNQYTIDASGDFYCGLMETVMNRLGFDRWVLGEWGDRRPGSTGSNPAPNDSLRAARLQVHLDRLLAANPKPDGLIYFNTIGTTGDHRILRPPYGNDDLTYAVLRDAMQEGWEAKHG